jgi:CheY-like chemotaxis protein
MSAGNATYQRTTEMMERQVQHLVRLVDDLLDISRITRGKVDLRREPVVLNEVVSGAIESCGLFSSDSHELHVEISPEPLTVMGDADRLRQVFSNLLSNAAKFTPHPGSVWVSLERSGANALVRVRDDGIGIPRDRLQHVFEMFAQGPDARRNDGLGIGLALVRQLIHLHGGTVRAESEGPGHGSQFIVCLPLAAHAEVGNVDGAPIASAHPRRILVVDDNVDAAETLQQMLRLQGHEVRLATSGQDAIKQVSRDPPELIFMDIGMPEMDGLTATRRIRALPQGSDIRIVALTGWGQERDRERTREAGMDGHLVKPVSPVELASVL